MIAKTFQLHIDASLLNFQFHSAVYVTVEYVTWKVVGGTISCHVMELRISPTVAKEINNYPELVRQASAGAQHNAEAYWFNQKEVA
jgi:hypothetical protein